MRKIDKILMYLLRTIFSEYSFRGTEFFVKEPRNLNDKLQRLESSLRNSCKSLDIIQSESPDGFLTLFIFCDDESAKVIIERTVIPNPFRRFK